MRLASEICAVAGVVLAAACHEQAALAPPHAAAASSHVLRLQPLSKTESTMIATAIKALAGRDPQVRGDVRLQQQPAAGDALAVLLAEEEAPAGSARVVPEICGQLVRRADPAITVCDDGGMCTPLDVRAAPTIVCNRRFFTESDVLSRVWTPKLFARAVQGGDLGVVQLVERAHTDPQGLIAEATPPVPGAAVGRDVNLFIFVLAHEMDHVANPPAEPGEGPAAVPPTAVTDARLRVPCRTFAEYNKRGYISFPVPSDAEIGAMGNAELRPLFARAHAIWESELRADAHATEMLQSIIDAIAPERSERIMLRLQAIDSLVLASTLLWFRREGTFLSALCPSVGGTDHVLTRCMCHDRENRWRAGQLLDELHPPITLRIAEVVEKLLEPLVDDEFKGLSGPQRDALRFLARVIEAEQNISFDIAWQTCRFTARTGQGGVAIVDMQEVLSDEEPETWGMASPSCDALHVP